MNMTEKLRYGKGRRIPVILVMIALHFSAFIPAATQSAYAADGTISLKVGRVIDYSSHFTHYYYAGDKVSPVYCAQPQLPSPKEGTYSYSFLSPDSMLAKCLYYGYGGPGFSDYTDRQLSGQWDGEDDAYCLTHIIISIAYDKTTRSDADPVRGLSENWKNKAKSLYSYVAGLPDPPANYRAYRIKIAGCQDIVGSFNDTGRIRLAKTSADTDMTDGNPNYSLAGAKYGVYYGNALIGTITTGADGTGSLDNILVGNYTVKEMQPSPGYAVDVYGHNVSVKADQTTSLAVKEIPQSDPIDLLLEKLCTEKPEGYDEMRAAQKAAEQSTTTQIFK